MVTLYETGILSKLYDLNTQIIIISICILGIVGQLVYTQNKVYTFLIIPFILYLFVLSRDLQQILLEDEKRQLATNASYTTVEWKDTIRNIFINIFLQIILSIIYIYLVFTATSNPISFSILIALVVFNIFLILYNWPVSITNILILIIMVAFFTKLK